MSKYEAELISMLRLMAGVRVIRHWARPGTGSLPPLIHSNRTSLPEILVLGASAGGPGALATLLGGLPKDFHLPSIRRQRRRSVRNKDHHHSGPSCLSPAY